MDPLASDREQVKRARASGRTAGSCRSPHRLASSPMLVRVGACYRYFFSWSKSSSLENKYRPAVLFAMSSVQNETFSGFRGPNIPELVNLMPREASPRDRWASAGFWKNRTAGNREAKWSNGQKCSVRRDRERGPVCAGYNIPNESLFINYCIPRRIEVPSSSISSRISREISIMWF